MAESNSHKLGQIIGEILETGLLPHLTSFARQHHLYLDKQGPRACRPTAKVTWKDVNGSSHDLDFVLEIGGTKTVRGIPIAFIETAWRRYTKHSRAKAQEIQGAIEPLAELYRQRSPFKGVVLAGVYTSGALNQLSGLGYRTVHIEYPQVIQAFTQEGVNIAFDESTSEVALKRKVTACSRLTQAQRQRIGSAMIQAKAPEMAAFLANLSAVATRTITRVRVLPLFGSESCYPSVAAAIAALPSLAAISTGAALQRFEVRVDFSNGDKIEANFAAHVDAAAFLSRL